MKRIVLLLIFLLSVNLAACKSPEQKEFTHLPKYKNMEKVDFQEAETSEGLDRATYTLDNITAKKFLDEYEEKMHTEGWTTANDNKPVSIDFKKDDQITIVAVKPTDDENKIQVLIYSKQSK